jgi:hypothetical protein
MLHLAPLPHVWFHRYIITMLSLSLDCFVVGLAAAIILCHNFENCLVAAVAVWNNLEERGLVLMFRHKKRCAQAIAAHVTVV